MISPDTRYPYPGKYEGERYMVPLLHQRSFPYEQFGDVGDFGLWFGAYFAGRRGEVFLSENSDGFVTELDRRSYEAWRKKYDEWPGDRDPFDEGG